MKKILLILILGIFITGCQKEKTFYLDKEYYGTNSLIEISSDELNDLEEKDATFVVFIYEKSCITSNNFSDVLTDFLKQYKMTFYQISFSDIENTCVPDYIAYYPSAAIYHNGEIVAYLRADSDKDIVYYESVDNFKSWLTKYIKLKAVN